MIQQVNLTLPLHSKGFHIVTQQILDKLPPLPETGLMHVFIQHTSTALSI